MADVSGVADYLTGGGEVAALIRQPAMIDLMWTGRDGPAMAGPTRQGFGTRLINIGVPREPGGSVVMDFASAGLVCRMHLLKSAKLGVLA